jgi:hypothetical protein
VAHSIISFSQLVTSVNVMLVLHRFELFCDILDDCLVFSFNIWLYFKCACLFFRLDLLVFHNADLNVDCRLLSHFYVKNIRN